MRKTVYILVGAAIIALANASAWAATKVFLLGGQSNMAGVGAYPGEPGYAADVPCPAPYNQPQTAVKFWNYEPNPLTNGAYWPGLGTGWINLQPGYGWQPGEFGPEVSFGYRLHQLFPDDDIYLVKEAISSQPLATTWNPNGGSIFNQFKGRVTAAVSDLTAAGKTPVISGMIWMQGETDTYGGPNSGADWSADYATNLTNLVNTVRSTEQFGNFADSEMPFILGRITTFYGSTDNNAVVRAAQMSVPSAVGHSAWIDTDDLQQIYGGHYGTQGQIDLGIRFANAFSSVPEPSFFALATTALLTTAAYCWRRRSRG